MFVSRHKFCSKIRRISRKRKCLTTTMRICGISRTQYETVLFTILLLSECLGWFRRCSLSRALSIFILYDIATCRSNLMECLPVTDCVFVSILLRQFVNNEFGVMGPGHTLSEFKESEFLYFRTLTSFAYETTFTSDRELVTKNCLRSY